MADDGVTIVVSPAVLQLPECQPYCLASEALLHMSYVDFRKREDYSSSVVPRLHGGPDLITTPAQGFASIRKHAVPARSALHRLEGNLSDENVVLAKSFERMCDTLIGPVHTFLISGPTAAWEATKSEMLKEVGWGRRVFLRSVVSHQESERQSVAGWDAAKAAGVLEEACTALSEQLGKREWFLGTEGPCYLDALVFGFLASILYPQDVTGGAFGGVWPRLAAVISKRANLLAFCEKVRLTYFEVYAHSFHLRSLASADAADDDEGAAVESLQSFWWCSSPCLFATTCSTVFAVTLNIEFLKRFVAAFREGLEEAEAAGE